MEAESVDQLVAIDAQTKKRQEVEELCQLEITKDWFPENCLQKLALDLERPAQSENLQSFYAKTLKMCLTHYQKVVQVSSVDRILTGKHLPPACRKQLLNHRDDLNYADTGEIGPNIELIKPHEDH